MHLSKRYNGIYYLWYTDDNGTRRKVSTHASRKSDALAFLKDFTLERNSRDLAPPEIPLSRFADEFCSYAKTVYAVSTLTGARLALDQMVRIIGDKHLRSIDVRDIEKLIAVKTEEASEWTARKYYIALASAFQTALRWGYVDENPFRKVPRPRTREVQPLHFSKDEFGQFYAAVTYPDMRDLFIGAVTTGMRLGELSALRWDQVDLERRLIFVRNTDEFTTKSRRNRTIPISDTLLPVLAKRKSSSKSTRVFERRGKPLAKDPISNSIKRGLKGAKLNMKLHFHSFRHTFASWLVEDGVSLYEVQKLLGHRNISTTAIYAHLAPSELHETVNRIKFDLEPGGVQIRGRC